MASVTVSEKLINLAGIVLPSISGITAVVWTSVPTAANQSPYQVISSLGSDVFGYVSFNINPSGVSINQPVWIAFFKDGPPPAGSMRKITPIYT